ncbi:MAG: class I SAM-dependent methyltransferase [Calditrichaceae bacterium]|nr:class I SAM-dependent methyltransferase [Calditrichia bacterium]NUQ40273.1 class I SAM-dependent methyltransferase [Calditrichaceae bacterium]
MNIQWRRFILQMAVFIFLCFSACQGNRDHPRHAGNAPADSGSANTHMHGSDFETLARNFEDPGREKWQKPAEVLALLGDLSGKTVADIGAGTGYFSFPLAEKAKKVIAVDIDRRFLEYIEQKNRRLATPLPIETRLATESDPRLQPGEANIAILVNTYHHIENRPEYFSGVRQMLAEGGAVVIVDFFKKELPVGPPTRLKLDPETVAGELKRAGFREIRIDREILEYQYIIIAR